MAIRAATREFSHFLVKYDDDTIYTCPRIKIVTEGRVRIGERYPVIYGTSSDNPETAEILDTGDYILMKQKETEHAVAPSSPLSSPDSPAKAASSPDSQPDTEYTIRKRKRVIRRAPKVKRVKQLAVMLSTGEGTSDPYQYRSPSVSPELPPHLLAPTPPSPTTPATPPPVCKAATTQTTPTNKDPPAFSIQQSLQAIEKQMQLSNTRIAEMERLMINQGNIIKEQGNIIKEQGNIIKELATKQRTAHLTPLPITPILAPIRLPTTPATPTTPRIPQPLPDLPLTPTSSLPDSPQPQPIMQRIVMPMHLFNDIPEHMRLTEDDFSKYSNCGTNPGSFGVLLLKHFFPELFTSDQLRIHYSYRGGGKLSKRPLEDNRKNVIKRYVTALFPSVNTESAYHALVVEKLNQYLRRPVQPATRKC
ncbi:uncharacterized protein LOC143059177 [Mytilus galloprovincialis]|uniref:uncharacterized protein LOC143059177 n=1 Tax=Mytilus galloprovincialis TaxID=29158 RepID=UPI003F7B6DF8